jgi:transposase-like protein
MKRDNVHDFQQMDIKMATNKPKRKTYSDEFKEFLVQEAEVSGRSIARDNGINQNLLHNWKREHKGKQSQTDRLPARIDNTAASNNSTFIPVNVTPEPNREQITDFITSNSSVLTGIQLQIPTHDNSHNAMPIKLTIDQIDNYSLIELLRGLQ